MVSMLVGVGASINIQRYRDAAETFKTLLQQQYADLTSVQNGRSDDWSCDATARPIEGGSELRGQSNCMLVGRYVRIEQDSILLYNVLARKVGTGQSTAPNDVERMKNNYIFNVDTSAIEQKQMEWGTALAWPASGTGAFSPTTPRSIGILVVRSPDSGQIYTFTSDSIPNPSDTVGPPTFSAMLTAGDNVPGQAGRTLCIASNGLFVSNDQSVYISAFANGASAVERRSNSYIESIGESTRC